MYGGDVSGNGNSRALFRGTTAADLSIMLRSSDPAPGLAGLTLVNSAANNGIQAGIRLSPDGRTFWSSFSAARAWRRTMTRPCSAGSRQPGSDRAGGGRCPRHDRRRVLRGQDHLDAVHVHEPEWGRPVPEHIVGRRRRGSHEQPGSLYRHRRRALHRGPKGATVLPCPVTGLARCLRPRSLLTETDRFLYT
jgi:hypothetical protein